MGLSWYLIKHDVGARSCNSGHVELGGGRVCFWAGIWQTLTVVGVCSALRRDPASLPARREIRSGWRDVLPGEPALPIFHRGFGNSRGERLRTTLSMPTMPATARGAPFA